MTNIKLKSPGIPHEPECVCNFACWWREMLELEVQMEYRRSSPEARAVWDGMLGMQIPSPNRALDAELRSCVRLWNARQESFCGTMLDALVAVARDARLEMPRHGLLAAFQLSRMLAEGKFPPCIGIKKAAG